VHFQSIELPVHHTPGRCDAHIRNAGRWRNHRERFLRCKNPNRPTQDGYVMECLRGVLAIIGLDIR